MGAPLSTAELNIADPPLSAWELDQANSTPKTDPRDNVIVLLIRGLMASDAEAKQFYLESAFREIFDDAYVDFAKREFKWMDGRQP